MPWLLFFICFLQFRIVCWDVQWGACGWCLKLELGAHLHFSLTFLFQSGAVSINLKCQLVIQWELKTRGISPVFVSPMLRVHFNCNASMRSRMFWDASCFDWHVRSWFQTSFLFCFCCTGLFTAFHSVMIIKRLYSWKLILSLISSIGLRVSGCNQGPK